MSALVSLLQDQQSVIERIRQDTVSICENRSFQSGLTADANGQASSENYSIFDSNIGDETFSFDDEIVNSFAYRNALKRLVSKTKATQQNAKPDEHHILDEPLIDLEDLPETHNEPRIKSTVTSNHPCLIPSKPFTQTADLSDTVTDDLKSLLLFSVESASQQRNERDTDLAFPLCDIGSPSDTSANQSDKNRDTQTSQIQERNVGRDPPPQRGPRPTVVPPMLQFSGYRHNEPSSLQHRKPPVQEQSPQAYWEEDYQDSIYSNHPVISSTALTRTNPFIEDVSDFYPVALSIPPYQPPPRRELGPLLSARKSDSSYYSYTSFLPPIPEEISEISSSYASSTIMSESWDDGLPEDYMGVTIYEEEEEDDASKENSERALSVDNDDVSCLVRKGDNAWKMSLDTIESEDESDRGSHGMQELD